MDLPFEASPDGGGFAGVRDDRDDFLRAQDLPDGHGDGFARNFVEAGKPALVELLPTASLVQLHDEVRLFGSKIGGRIIECKVAVFTDADKGEINRRGKEFATYLLNYGLRVQHAIQPMKFLDTGFVNETLQEILAKAGGVRDRQADILIQVKDLQPRPIDVRQGGERIEKLELRGARGGNQPHHALLAQEGTEGVGGGDLR